MSEPLCEIVQNLTPVMRMERVLAQQDHWAAQLSGRVGRMVGARAAAIRLTESDVQLLLTLIRYRCVVIDDLVVTVDMHIDSVRRRLGRMVAAGLVTRTAHGPLARTVYMASTAAMKMVGVSSREASGAWGQMNHRLILAHWGVVMQLHRWAVVTEFEIGVHPSQLLHARRQLPVNRSAYGTEAGWARALLSQRTHRPDLVVRDPESGCVRAIEVELTLKNAAKLREVMLAYGRSPHIFDGVIYACAEPKILAAVHKAAISVGFDRLTFQELPAPQWVTR